MSKKTRLLHKYNDNSVASIAILGAVVMGLGLASMAVRAQSPIAGRLTSIPGLSPAETNAAAVIEDICPPGNLAADLQTRCNSLVGVVVGTGNQDEGRIVLQQVAPEQIATQGTYAVQLDPGQFDNVIGRLSALRTGVTGISLSGFPRTIEGHTVSGEALANQFPNGMTGGAAGTEDSGLLGKLGIFVNGIGTTGEQDTTATAPGFDFSSAGVTAGADYRLADNFILGAAFGYDSVSSDFSNNGGSLDMDQYSISGYGTYYLPQGFYVDGLLSYGWNNFESSRNFDYGFTTPAGDLERVVTQAKSEPDSTQFAVSAGAGYELTQRSVTLTPYARVNFIRMDIDAFTETRADGWGIRYNDQEIDSLTTQLGGQASYAVSTQWGVLSPLVLAEWIHEFENEARSIPVSFIGDPGANPFVVPTNAPDRDFFNVGAGISGTFARGVSAFFYYEALLGYKNLDRNLFTGGVRFEF
nr:autotransporter outer membrane beta-barrel domain-containing protein [Gammaproteobacteria bacterium]